MGKATPRNRLREMGKATPRNRLVALGTFVLGSLTILEINDSPFLPGAHDDSVQYMEAARSLVRGSGLSVPISSWASPDTVSPLSHFPPGTSVVIGGMMWASGVRPDVAALWMISLAAGATLALVFLLVAVEEGWGVGILSALVVFILPPFLLVHAAIWSEPLYLVLLLATLWLMVRFPRRPAYSGMTAAAAVMVRYLGVAAVGSVGLWTFFKTRSVRKTLVGMVPGLVAFLAWWGWTRSQGGAVRTPGQFSVPFSNTLAQLPDAVGFWLAPGLPLVVALLLLSGVVAAHVVGRKTLTGPLSLLILAHLAVIIGSRLWMDERIPFDGRMFLPVIVLAMLPVVSSLWRLRVPGLIILLAWAGWILKEDVQGIGIARESGLYYTASGWLASGVLPWLSRYREDLPIYTNEPGFVVFHLERSARLLPLRTQDLNDFLRVWGDNPGAIVLLQPQRADEWTAEIYQEGLPLETALSSGNALVLVPSNMDRGGGADPGGADPGGAESGGA